MRRLTGPELQEARRRSAERLVETARGIASSAGVVEVVEINRLAGRYSIPHKRIKTPRPTTRLRLFLFAQLCAYVALDLKSLPRYRQHVETTKWAIAALRTRGITVPRKAIERAKEGIEYSVRKAIARGAKRIDAPTRQFLGMSASHAGFLYDWHELRRELMRRHESF